MPSRKNIAVFLDSPDENWLAMNLAGEMLLGEWKTSLAREVSPSAFTIDLPHVMRNLPRIGKTRAALQLDIAAGRFIVYPPRAVREARRHDFFHIVDHSYAQLVHVLPHRRTGVYCHDLDAFRSILGPARQVRPPWFRAMQWVTLLGLRSAEIVFHSTNTVRDEIERSGIVPASRLVQAPYGIAAEFRPEPQADAKASELLAALEGRPFLLHVGSAIARKRLDVLFETFARLKDKYPALHLVQGGAALSDAQRAHIAKLGIGDRLVIGGKLGRPTLAALYRQAKAVLVTSESEGFGLPVIEALACGAPVFASDIPVLREVGEACAVFCRLGVPDHWAAQIGRYLDGELTPPPVEDRLALASKYSWKNHARAILDAYLSLEDGTRSERSARSAVRA
jgi:glycosyltransferase involved in cell wall biosynthesis